MFSRSNTSLLVLFFLSLLAASLANCDQTYIPPYSKSNLSIKTACLNLPNKNPIAQISHKIPTALGPAYAHYFTRCIKIIAPNGKPIYILAQKQITTNQMLRANAVLQMYLTDVPGSAFGENKSEVVNKMADNHAKLLLLNGKDYGSNPAAQLDGQPLFHDEIQVEGGPWYIKQDYKNHRDATFEEILHLVHDTGIGVDGNGIFIGALKNYQKKIRAGQINALSNHLWGIGAKDWIQELTKENSLTQEYLAAVVDVYYGLWGAWNGSKIYGMDGLYITKTREGIARKDPKGLRLLNDFFPVYLTYNARIDQNFKGTFSLKFNKSLPYTHQSQYLKNITLTGNNNTSIIVNQLNDYITGNGGINTVIFSGKYSQYIIKRKKHITIVIDKKLYRDGVSRLKSIEKLQFSDKTITLE